METQQKRTSWLTTILMAGLLFFYLWRDYKKNPLNLGNYLLALSVLITIAGIGVSFSKNERQRTRERVIAELPDRASLIENPDADKKTKHRGYILLAVGIVLFVAWCTIYGFSSLAGI